MSALDDPWIQVLLLTAMISGAATLHAVARPAPIFQPAATPRAAAMSGGVAASGGASIPAPSVLPFEPAASAPAGPSLEQLLAERGASAASAPAAARPKAAAARLTAKKPGRWIVDASGAKDADSSSLAQVVGSAKAGDRVLVRKGFYREPLVLLDELTIEGEGGAFIESGAPETVTISAKASLKNLTIRNIGAKLGVALGLKTGEATLEGVTLEATGESAGAAALDGKLSLKRCVIRSGSMGIIANGSARLEIADSEIRGTSGPGVGLSGRATARLESVRIEETAGAGVLIKNEAQLEMIKGAISKARGCGLAFDGGSAELKGVKISASRCAVEFISGGRLESSNGEFPGNKQLMIFQQAFRPLISIGGTNNRPALKLEDMYAAPPDGNAAPGNQRIGRAWKSTRAFFGEWDVFSGEPLKSGKQKVNP